MWTISLIFFVLLEICVIRSDTEVTPSTLECPGVGFEWANPSAGNPNFIDIFYDVSSWGDCAKICKDDANCATWIYWWSSAASWAFQCRTWTHDNENFVEIVVHRNNNTLMGTRECQADIDECIGEHECSDLAACANTYGSYTCSCNPGYKGDGFECTDINECESSTANCPADSTCENSIGDYECACDEGYEKNGDECIIHSCSSQFDFENGLVHGRHTYGETITYSCDTNYRLIGEATRTCGLDGWSGDEPECEEKYCTVTPRSHNGNIYDTWECSDGTGNCKITGNKVKVGTSIKTSCYTGGAKKVYMANSDNVINECKDHLTWEHEEKKPFCYEYCAKLWENDNDKGDIWVIKEHLYKDLSWPHREKDLNNKKIDNDDIEQYKLWTGCNLVFYADEYSKSKDDDNKIRIRKSSAVGTSQNNVPNGWGGKITALKCYCN